MIPLVDMHCHLYAEMDDGPRSWDDALAMCRIAHEQGTQLVAATAHQNETWKTVTPQRIRDAAIHLSELLKRDRLPLTVYPCAEVMAHPDMESDWDKGDLLSVGDRKTFLLVEMPHQIYIDLRPVVQSFRDKGVRVILAHPERHAELLHDPGTIEEMIHEGCLVQVSSGSITNPKSPADERALKSWFKRGVVHVIGSDGHSPRRRPPHLAEAYHQIARWVGSVQADRICSCNGLAVLQGMPVRVPEPRARKAWSLPLFW